MKLLKDIDRATLKSKYGTKEVCLKHLEQVKWANGFQCRRCSNATYIKGKQFGSRRCRKCNYDESATSHTIFHKLKFGIDKAFEMLYEIAASKKGANSIWLAEHFGVNQKTAWLFRQKVLEAMKSSGNHPLEGDVHVDEFEIGTPKKGEQGRSFSSTKMRVVIAYEYRDGKSGRGYGKVIRDYSTDSLRPIFEDHIKKDALVLADGWTGYGPLKKEYPNLRQILSENGQNFKMLHIQIRNFKNWLRGVHSYCNAEYLQKYIDEYFFRYNRRNHRSTILEKLIERCVQHPHVSAKKLRPIAI